MATNSRDLPLVPGAVAGVAAYVLGYLFTYALTSGDLRDSGLNRAIDLLGGGDATVQLVGWVFYSAHFVPTVLDVDIPVLGGTDSVNVIAATDAFSPVLYVIPALLLLGAGLALGRRYLDTAALDDAVLTGATVVAGYLPLSVLGAFLFELQGSSASGSPDLVLAAGLAGVVYPVVLGALGGVVAGQT